MPSRWLRPSAHMRTLNFRTTPLASRFFSNRMIKFISLSLPVGTTSSHTSCFAMLSSSLLAASSHCGHSGLDLASRQLLGIGHSPIAAKAISRSWLSILLELLATLIKYLAKWASSWTPILSGGTPLVVRLLRRLDSSSASWNSLPI